MVAAGGEIYWLYKKLFLHTKLALLVYHYTIANYQSEILHYF